MKTQEPPKNNTRERSGRKELIHDIIFFAVLIAALILVEKFIILNAKIPSESMQNTINIGDRVIGNRLAYINKDPGRYDIVIFRYPDEPEKMLIKRVIGLPGDTIDIRNGDVFINGSETPLTDSFCSVENSTLPGNLTYPVTVPEGCYFMMGDNRTNSKDSRYWENAFLERDEILAEASFRYWPLDQIGFVNKDTEAYYQPPEAE